MTPRGTDWSLAFLVALLSTTGVLGLVSGEPGARWVFLLHGAGGAMIALVVFCKLRRVWRRLVRWRIWDRRTIWGAGATVTVGGTIASGLVWSSGGNLYLGGFNLLNWHILMGIVLTAAVVLHSSGRAKPLRDRDLLQRRQALQLTGFAGLSALLWMAQRPLASRAGWRGAGRRWTGSYEQNSFAGNMFPTSSWVADAPRPLARASYRLRVGGLVAHPHELDLTQLEAGDRLEATLDCTGGFYSTQHWQGLSLERLLDRAAPFAAASYVDVVSHTGYRWSFPMSAARSFLLATHVGGEALSHAHGGPVRLVAPGRRGFQWIKWIVEIRITDRFDAGAPASTIWSSWTREGRGEA